MTKLVYPVGTALLILSAACGDATGPDPFQPPEGLAECGSAPALAQFPVPVAAVSEIGPLGSMSGGGHLFPATHLGVHLRPDLSAPVPLSAPGSLVIRQVARVTFTGPGVDEADYAVYWFPCAEVRMHFGHVTDVDPGLLAQVGTFTASDCAEPYVVAGITTQPCTRDVSIELAAGDAIGTQLGTMDWGATDRRVELAYVNPARMGGNEQDHGQNNAVCPVDYLPPAVRASVHGLFGEGGVRRTAEPVCGTVMQDVPGTVQGRWFINDDWNERLHLGLVRDQIDPTVAAFSVGTSIPSLPTDLYRFDPVQSGRVDVDFPMVRADGLIYCYEPEAEQSRAQFAVWIQLLSDTRLRIEGRAGEACGPPDAWSFTAGAVEFMR